MCPNRSRNKSNLYTVPIRSPIPCFRNRTLTLRLPVRREITSLLSFAPLNYASGDMYDGMLVCTFSGFKHFLEFLTVCCFHKMEDFGFFPTLVVVIFVPFSVYVVEKMKCVTYHLFALSAQSSSKLKQIPVVLMFLENILSLIICHELYLEDKNSFIGLTFGL